MAASAVDPRLTWNLVTDVRQLFDFPFMVNALRAGTIVAALVSVIGWFVVLRRQTFAAHTLSLIGFPGAAGAVWLGLSAQLGFFAFCVAGAVVIAALPRSHHGAFGEETAVIATVQAFALACGFLFVSLYRGNLNGINTLLFGSFLGVTDAQVRLLLVVAVAGLVVIAVLGRPLLFASVDPDVARARGVPVRLVSTAFLLLVGAAAAACSQITGSLLVFALLVLPAATAQRVTTRPGRSLAVAVLLAVMVTWGGLAVAYYSPFPIGFWITTFAFAGYLVAGLPRAATASMRA
jgi:zinc/manganese transport system permease protein